MDAHGNKRTGLGGVCLASAKRSSWLVERAYPGVGGAANWEELLPLNVFSREERDPDGLRRLAFGVWRGSKT